MHDQSAAPVAVRVTGHHVGPSYLGLPSKRPRLLLVEDDDGDALIVSELLGEIQGPWGEVVRARTVAEAVQRLGPEVGCVLLDLGLPDAQGMEALHIVLGAAGRAAVVCLTGLDESRGLAAVAAGAQDYLVKGQVDRPLLDRALRYALERRRADEQSRQLYATRLQAAENARLERGLLPQPHVRSNRVTITTRYRPGRDSVLGGDFYDVVELTDGTLLVLVGDVAGHGPDEAALGVCLRIAWRTLVLAGAPLDRLFPLLHEVLVAERRSPEVFTTACMLALSPDLETADLWLAGHHAPVLLGARPTQVEAIRRGPALGLQVERAWTPQRVDLAPGWRLLLFTDGWIEGRVGDGPRRLGVQGLLDLAARSAATCNTPALLDELLACVVELNGGPLPDDVAIVALERSPEPDGSPSPRPDR